jgi:hypothetical protein
MTILAPTSYIIPFFETTHNCELRKNDFLERWTILLDHFSEWLPRRMTVLDHSPTLTTRGIVFYGTSTICRTMIVGFGPFSELENECSSKILDHFPDWKVTSQPGPFSKLENEFPYINNISVLPPHLGSNNFLFQ